MPAGAGAFAETGERSRRCASRATISASSICATAKPMQLRAPDRTAPRSSRRALVGRRSNRRNDRDRSARGPARQRHCGPRDAPTRGSMCPSGCPRCLPHRRLQGAPKTRSRCTARARSARTVEATRASGRQRPRDDCGRDSSGPRRTAGEVGRPGAPSDRPIMPDGEHEAALPKCRSGTANVACQGTRSCGAGSPQQIRTPSAYERRKRDGRPAFSADHAPAARQSPCITAT
jgi:hypothetical protein